MNYEYTETEEAVLKVLQGSDPLLQPDLDLTLPGGMRIVGSWTPGGSFATLHIILNRVTTVTVNLPMRAAWALAEGQDVDGWRFIPDGKWFGLSLWGVADKADDESSFYIFGCPKGGAEVIEKFLLRGKAEHHEPDPDEPTPFNPMGDAA